MRINQIFLLVLLMLFSCTEDVSREISTDLTQEANQLFQFSQALSESNYLGNISYQDYFRISSSELPGCPTIVRSLASRIIVLDYSNPTEFTQENSKKRTGKIILDFTLSNTANPTWVLQYEDYSLEGTKVKGMRQFRAITSNETEAEFENLEVELAKNLSFLSSGKLNHSVSRSSLRPFALSTRGKVEGKNPAGREFSITITEAKEQLFACYRDGWDLTQSGKEAWEVSRGSTSEVIYIAAFQTNTGCNPVVTATLPDGKIFQLNP
ncbi:hypothetical protein [Algoriphagus sp. AK58]|uniref:hypothetical protein n=1 Tax=Algoriphagus sp. AK58 TaxID=1406877 RepID=UPI00164FD8D5|nr:hypothetical protein [Algoriphagus sp. AK58]